MPVYAYHCAINDTLVEVSHSMREDLKTWGEVCARADIDPGETPLEAPVERQLYAALLNTPAGDAKLKELGFTKLVRRDKGVYENVTAGHGENKIMDARDPSSVPDFSKKIGD